MLIKPQIIFENNKNACTPIPETGLQKASIYGKYRIPRILWNPKVYYRVHKSSPMIGAATLSPTYGVLTILLYIGAI
jgi:hypothetical protein